MAENDKEKCIGGNLGKIADGMSGFQKGTSR
jgi:hypothetical protein